MQIKYHPDFIRSFQNMSRGQQQLVRDTIDFFKDDPTHPSLRNHPLRGRMQGKRSLSVSDDLRIIFTERGGYTSILVLDVGTHEEVYSVDE